MFEAEKIQLVFLPQCLKELERSEFVLPFRVLLLSVLNALGQDIYIDGELKAYEVIWVGRESTSPRATKGGSKRMRG